MQFQDERDVFGRMLVLTNNPIFNNLRNAVDNYNADLSDSLSWGQLKSKRWLISELENLNIDLGTIFLCAGWYATLAAMLFDSNLKIEKIRSFDIDPNCANIAETINRHNVKDSWRFKASTEDILNLNYKDFYYTSYRFDGSDVELCDTANTIINTSCEHIQNFEEWYAKIPSCKLVVLQSNNYFDLPEHVNCVQGPIDFAEQSPMTELLYQGVLELPKYTRFMRIGYK